jgi:hypothetical protein
MKDIADGAPKVGADIAAKLAKWWTDRSGTAELQALMKSLEIAGYPKAANDLRTVFGTGPADPVERAAALSDLLNRNGNLISLEMTELAVRGVAATGQDSIAALDAELSRFGFELVESKRQADSEYGRIVQPPAAADASKPGKNLTACVSAADNCYSNVCKGRFNDSDEPIVRRDYQCNVICRTSFAGACTEAGGDTERANGIVHGLVREQTPAYNDDPASARRWMNRY